MTITGIEYICSSPYLNKDKIAKALKVGTATVDNRIKEIKKETERYGDFAFIKDGGIILVNFLVLVDYIKYRESLLSKWLRKNVPPYNPLEISKELNWSYDLKYFDYLMEKINEDKHFFYKQHISKTDIYWEV